MNKGFTTVIDATGIRVIDLSINPDINSTALRRMEHWFKSKEEAIESMNNKSRLNKIKIKRNKKCTH